VTCGLRRPPGSARIDLVFRRHQDFALAGVVGGLITPSFSIRSISEAARL
jgi:hypothetical protein